MSFFVCAASYSAASNRIFRSFYSTLFFRFCQDFDKLWNCTVSYSCVSFATVGVKNSRRNASAKMPQEIKMVFRNEKFSRTSVFDFKIREILISGFVK